MAQVEVEGVAVLTPSVAVLTGVYRSFRAAETKTTESTHREGDVCGTESLVNLRGASPTSDGRRDVLENEGSTFATGAIVMCTV
jgi:hypothetical protein